MSICAHLAGEVEQQHVQAAAADLDTDRERAVRVQRHRHRGLADLAARRFELLHQRIGLEARDDDLHRLRREPGQPRDVGLRDAAVQADRLQHDALVELAHADVVRAARPQPLFRDWRPSPDEYVGRSPEGIRAGLGAARRSARQRRYMLIQHGSVHI